MNQPSPPEPRLPDIDPVTFAALSTLDAFLARALLTRQEHAEANRSLQLLVQTLESLQSTVRQMGAPAGAPVPAAGAGGAPAGNGGRIAAGVAEEIFRNAG